MAVLLSLVVMSRLAQSSPLYDEMEGAGSYLESQAGNTVPMIGKKASSVQSDEREVSETGSPSKLLYLLRFLDLGLRGRQSPMLGKRSGPVEYPLWFKQDLARLGKRGFPGFSIPDSWRKSKPQARDSISNLRNKIYNEDREKRNLQSNSLAWYPRRDSSWFRFHDGDTGSLGSVLYKRSENPHIKDFNSVPFMGKRAEVTDGSGLKVTAGEDDVLVRKPREEDKELEGDFVMNPWQFVNLESQLRRM